MDKQSALLVINAIAYLVLFSQIFLGFSAVAFILRNQLKSNKTFKQIVQILTDNSIILAFFIALFATFSSLFLSEIAHFIPCKLCWYQRICMYPLTVILGISALKNDLSVKKYVLPLAVIGAGIAIYHYLLQMSPIPLPCSDEVANCSLKQVGYFGYITIPMMALTAFALIIFFMLLTRGKKSISG